LRRGTDIAPTGRPLSERVLNSTEIQTSTPAINPMMTEAQDSQNPEGAVMATSPASKPLPLIEASVCCSESHVQHRRKGARHARRIVFTAIDPIRKLPLPKHREWSRG